MSVFTETVQKEAWKKVFNTEINLKSIYLV